MTDENNLIEEVVETSIVVEPAKPKAKRKPRKKKEDIILKPESNLIEWKIRIGKDEKRNVIYQTGSYELEHLFNELYTILTPRGAKYTYNKDEKTIQINGMYGYVSCLNIVSPKEDILRVARSVPTRKSIVGNFN